MIIRWKNEEKEDEINNNLDSNQHNYVIDFQYLKEKIKYFIMYSTKNNYRIRV